MIYLYKILKGIMLSIGKRLEEVRIFLDLNKKDFAKELGITQNSYTNYINESRKVPVDLAVTLYEKSNVSMNWFLTGQGNMFIDEIELYINTLDDLQKSKLLQALKRAHYFDEVGDFIESVEDFYIFSNLKTKFKNISSEYPLWKKFLSGKRDKNSFILIFAKVLKEFELSSKMDSIIEPTAKTFLIELITQYHLKLVTDKLLHLLTEKEKNDLIKWVETNMSDFDAYIVLKNIPIILNILREEINIYNKKAF